MKIQVNQVRPSYNSNGEKMKTFLIFDILVKLCYYPVTISREKVTFKFFSWRTLFSQLPLFISFIIGGCVIEGYYKLRTIHPKSEVENTELISLASLFLIHYLFKLSNLFISFGLQFVKPKRLQITKQSPQQKFKLFAGRT